MILVTQRWFMETGSPHDSAGDSAASIIDFVTPTGTPTLLAPLQAVVVFPS
jgi:hypothetical protein